jgi:hypothetical protein
MHPIVVGVPLVAWGTSLGFDLASHFGRDDNGFARLSQRAIVVGLAGGFVSGIFGLRDLVRFSPERPAARPLAAFHATMNACAVGFYSLAALRRAAVATEGSLDGDDGSALRPVAGRLTLGDACSNAAALLMLGVSGYIGGKVARRFDVRPGIDPSP